MSLLDPKNEETSGAKPQEKQMSRAGVLGAVLAALLAPRVLFGSQGAQKTKAVFRGLHQDAVARPESKKEVV